MRIEPVEATLGAVVSDVNLAALTGTEWEDVQAAFLRYGVLVFPGQHLDAAAQGPGIDRKFGGRPFHGPANPLERFSRHKCLTCNARQRANS